MKDGPRYRFDSRSIQRLIEIAVIGAVQSVGKSRVFHRDFSKLLLKPASFQGFNRSGTVHSAPRLVFHPLQSLNTQNNNGWGLPRISHRITVRIVMVGRACHAVVLGYCSEITIDLQLRWTIRLSGILFISFSL